MIHSKNIYQDSLHADKGAYALIKYNAYKINTVPTGQICQKRSIPFLVARQHLKTKEIRIDSMVIEIYKQKTIFIPIRNGLKIEMFLY